MDESEREAILDRVTGQSATVGASVPDTVTIDGNAVDLSEFIVETRAVETVPPDVERKVSSVKSTLRAERERRMARLRGERGDTDAGDPPADEPLDRGTAERLADEVVGIDRALNALETIRHPDFADEHRSATLDGHERWLAFVDDVR
ncbi:hypothetical protein C463_16442 [Halorubrum californiense DSM 19288]|uniref:Uncharacterized protein n=1 Tax=Halorubrum californiense DSM 19288 TaxID=1227465 RepID=M0DZI9_9EURY|nr:MULTISPECIES: DUF5788 family protein [Halorubrum]ELZ40107.1 hypothetical protein C463_16442 [Halorubrum californiense DSM 19288]TKX73176.1 hypothetical protein EXE40_00140 [Halorubrum sp. GN11GM_10-3_MGM]